MHIPLTFETETLLEFWKENYFTKSFGKVRITEVFKIKIGLYNDSYGIIESYKNGSVGKVDGFKNFAERDGFKTVDEMFAYLDKAYDLSTPKEFWVYRWEYL